MATIKRSKILQELNINHSATFNVRKLLLESQVLPTLSLSSTHPDSIGTEDLLISTATSLQYDKRLLEDA